MPVKKLEIIIGDTKNVSEEIAGRTTREIIAREKSHNKYVIACAKGSSALEYYQALGKKSKQNSENGAAFENVAAFSIDDDWGTRNGYDFLENNMPKGTLNFSILEQAVIKDADFMKPLEIKQEMYGQIGRALQPLGVTRGSVPYKIYIICRDYEKSIMECGGIDTAIIGLGVNPMHIGSNFPDTHEAIGTHLGEKIDKDGNVTGYAMSMGIATLCSAKKAVLFASGEKKADGVKEFFECPIDKSCPPSYLRNMNHLIVALDKPSASKLDFGELKKMYQSRQLLINYV